MIVNRFLIRLIFQNKLIIIHHIFKKFIKQQTDINHDLQRIQFSYEDQSKKNIPINEFRQIISNELQKLSTIENSLLPEISFENHQDQQLKNVNVNDLNNRTINEIS